MAVSTEFKFWEEENIPVDRGQECAEDQFGDNSPPLWAREQRVYKREGATWLQQYNHYVPTSTKLRRKAIQDGRQEMMDMIKDLPESAFELSLKDIVDDQENMAKLQETKVVLTEEKNVKQTKGNIRLAKNSNNTSDRRICRSESMESEFVQIKMCLPLFMNSRSRSGSRKSSRICNGLLLDRSDKSQKPTVIDRWKMILAVKESHRTKTSTSDTARTSSVENNLTPCRCSLGHKKCKSEGRPRCLFIWLCCTR